MASEFTEQVIKLIKSIPFGKVNSYGQIAAMAGSPRAARQVVRILHTLSEKEKLPWHRVVNKSGGISLNRGQGYELQKAMLEDEGIIFDRFDLIDMNKFQQINKIKKIIFNEKITIGISSCLLGENVRFDGSNKYEKITKSLNKYFDFISICPEVEAGLGTPRPPIRLEGNFNKPSVISIKSRKDLTKLMNRYCKERLNKKDVSLISGYVLKSRSPSCGTKDVKIYNNAKIVKGQGLFTKEISRKYSNLPIINNDQLNNVKHREQFINQTYAYTRINNLFSSQITFKQLLEFHNLNLLIMMSHNYKLTIELSEAMLTMRSKNLAKTKEYYLNNFMNIFRFQKAIIKQVKVFNYLKLEIKQYLSEKEKLTISKTIQKYRSNQNSIKTTIKTFKAILKTNKLEKYSSALDLLQNLSTIYYL